MSLFSHGLLPATFRGVPFAVRSTNSGFGRRIALHQYPGRDEPWAEDMGRGARRLRFRGFLVANDRAYGGGPIPLQRLALIAAAERKGAGVLTHPTLGILQVACESCIVGEEIDAGRFSEIEFVFVEAGKKAKASLLTSASGLITQAVAVAITVATDVAGLIKLAEGRGGRRKDAGNVAAAFQAQLASLGSDPAARPVSSTPDGNIGRYAGGANTGFLNRNVRIVSPDDGARQRALSTSLARLASTGNAYVATGDALSLCTAADGAVNALVAGLGDPSAALRLLGTLSRFTPTTASAATPIGQAITLMFRASAALAGAAVSATYQPASHDDAQRVLTTTAARLDGEAVAMADAGLDGSFAAMRDMRGASVQDLRLRGAELPDIKTFRFARPMPSQALAQRIYRDAARDAQLVRQADPVSPLFMPRTFNALAA